MLVRRHNLKQSEHGQQLGVLIQWNKLPKTEAQYLTMERLHTTFA